MANDLKKILYISNFGDVKGGGEISLLTLVRELNREKYEPIIAVPDKGNMWEKAEELGAKPMVLDIPGLGNPLALASFAYQARRFATFLKKENIALVHANTNTRKFIFSGLAAKMAGVPCVCHVRVMDSDGFYEKIVLSLFDRVIANSDATAGKFMKFKGSEKKVITVHNAVDLENFQPGPSSDEIRASLGAGPEDILVCIVGFIHEFKGHKYFIEAAGKLRDNRHLKFAIIGNGPLMDECVSMSREFGLEGSVRFAGLRNDVPDIMRSMDILALSSIAEHFGRVLIEAMACGKPVIGTRAGGVPEIIEEGKTGLMVPPKDSDALATAIAALAKDKNMRDSMGAQGAKTAVERFSAQRHAASIQRIYETLLSQRNGE